MWDIGKQRENIRGPDPCGSRVSRGVGSPCQQFTWRKPREDIDGVHDGPRPPTRGFVWHYAAISRPVGPTRSSGNNSSFAESTWHDGAMLSANPMQLHADCPRTPSRDAEFPYAFG